MSTIKLGFAQQMVCTIVLITAVVSKSRQTKIEENKSRNCQS